MEEKQIKIHYGELSTKGKNRKMFQQKMAEQIRHKTKHIERIKIYPNRDFMFIKWEQASYEELIEVLKDIPGISRFEPVYPVAKDMDAIKKRALELFSELNIQDGESFKVVAKRSDKEFELDTYAIQREVGDVIGEAYQNLAVKMTRPTYKLTVSIHLKDEAYLSLLSYPGLQGMPYGSSGRGMLMLSGGFDSPIAGYLMMRRGMEIEAVHFSSPPYTSPQALEKAKKLTAKLAHFGMPIKFHNVPFAKIQEEIKAHVPDSESMTVMRRFMLRIMDQLIEQNNADAIVNGESLGQVASQTIKSMRVINEVTSTPIFRPLIATDKNEIIALAEKIDTFDISNEPYEDCCTVFAPTAPHTKPKQEKIEDYELALDVEALVKDAVENTHIEKIDEDYIKNQEADFANLL
ncbi:tRNA uracil 4-sulfurtransferase ThiI [Ruoffia tabacinasalis]|mgnify:CR=1 FL=1|jgi:thiamine biosynthesis protein ThiI|uniref:Probable tRNA sulfurtransferase n=1 Tax=Ruoffia tabacinasalis TaxID=87458 RepID=A0ABS0LM12_9LACT|nr:tRNA uracil 4-sulfurtransferase ThiI [Ruoffia tabacinasalis]MBG9979325.1 tRNA 4-thiouridine(8) synthase ThiI [Ruoffia tabacinasalis]